MAKKKVNTAGRVTRRMREEVGLPSYLPYSNDTTPQFRRAIDEKSSEPFQTIGTLKWLAKSQEISEVIDTLNLYPVIHEDQYAVVLEGNLANETLVLVLKIDNFSDELISKLKAIDPKAVEGPAEDSDWYRGENTVVYDAENEAFYRVLKDLSTEMAFTPAVIYMDTDNEVDLYYRSCIRKIAASKLSLQYETICILVDDILENEEDHADATRLKADCITQKMDYPYQDDVYYFISWGGEENGYRLRRDTEMSPRLGS
ncbi:MAG: hypothetical protein NC548_15535 [Lachnospiraceae bacterium]|nr:hypothetical protein [Lachnospiraceae bacterium]